MTHTIFVETFDNEGRPCIRLNRRNGRILARWRDDMPGQTCKQWVREKKAVIDGFGELCYTAMQCALYQHGLSDFSPAVHSPERGLAYRVAY